MYRLLWGESSTKNKRLKENEKFYENILTQCQKENIIQLLTQCQNKQKRGMQNEKEHWITVSFISHPCNGNRGNGRREAHMHAGSPGGDHPSLTQKG